MSELPAWFFGPARGWRVEDLANLPPEAPQRLELIDGGLAIMSPQKLWHMKVVDALVEAFRTSAPRDLDVAREMLVVCAPRQAPEPDVCIVRRGALPDDLEATMLHASDVRLVVEVVSPDSEIRDKERKPQIYAAAGIPRYWIVDREGRTSIVHVYELDPVHRAYGPATTFRDRVEVVLPFPVQVDLSEERLRA
jgi:Uma2 family endonuclease